MSSRRLIVGVVVAGLMTVAAGLALWSAPGGAQLPAIAVREFEPPPPPEGGSEVARRQGSAPCGKLPRPVPVTVVGGSYDVIPVKRFGDALEVAINATPPLQLTGHVPCVLVVHIPDGPNARSFGGTIDPQNGYDERMMISWRVNVYQEGGPFLGSFVGSCWLDEVEKCGKRAAEDVLAAALTYRSW